MSTSRVSTINSVVSSQLLYNLLPLLLKTLIASNWQYSLQYLPRREHINCQFPTCRNNTGVRCVWGMYSKVATSEL